MTPEELRDAVEDDLREVFDDAVREFLALVQRAALDSSRSLTAAAPTPEDPLTLGAASTWWQAVVDSRVIGAVRSAWRRAYRETRGGRVISTSQDAAADYLSAVRDRLVRGIEPPIADEAFDAVRISTSQALAEGWDRPQLARRIGAELDWETDEPYWRSEQARYDHQIDEVLDRYGPPGTPSRETARKTDPEVSKLQAGRARAILARERSESTWQVRSKRIARTEATGATNYAAIRALADEGRTHKQWLAAGGPRTRPAHAAADGQVVAIGTEFTVGGVGMQMPGDPSAPAALVVNCRCTVLGANAPADETPDTPETEPEEPDTPSLADVAPADLSEEELQTELERLMSDPAGFEDPRLDALAREMDERDYRVRRAAESAAQLEEMRQEALEREAWGNRPWRRSGGEKALREEYDTFVEVQYLTAEAELNGVLLSAEGKMLQARGEMDVRDLFTRRRRSLRYASEELQEWFSRNPRMSFPEFRGGAVGDDIGRAARTRSQNRGWESEFG